MTRKEHVTACQERASALARNGLLGRAVEQMVREMGEYPETRVSTRRQIEGLLARHSGQTAVYDWIDSFE